VEPAAQVSATSGPRGGSGVVVEVGRILDAPGAGPTTGRRFDVDPQLPVRTSTASSSSVSKGYEQSGEAALRQRPRRTSSAALAAVALACCVALMSAALRTRRPAT
jgi:hypothetical protein